MNSWDGFLKYPVTKPSPMKEFLERAKEELDPRVRDFERGGGFSYQPMPLLNWRHWLFFLVKVTLGKVRL